MKTKLLAGAILAAGACALALALLSGSSLGTAPKPKQVWLPLVAKQRVLPSRTATRTPTPTRTSTRTSTPTRTPTPTATSACDVVPVLSSPANGSELDTLIPLYEWDSGNNPNATKLRLEVCKNASCSTLFTSFNSSYRVQGVWDFRFTRNLDPATTYYWRARLECGAVLGAWSAIWSFKTGPGGVILPGPDLIAPPNNTVLPGNSVTAQWSAVSGAVEYVARVQYSEWTSNYVVTPTQTLLDGLEPNTLYPWWVQARNDYAWGSESVHWQFTTPAALAGDVPFIRRDAWLMRNEGWEP